MTKPFRQKQLLDDDNKNSQYQFEEQFQEEEQQKYNDDSRSLNLSFGIEVIKIENLPAFSGVHPWGFTYLSRFQKFLLEFDTLHGEGDSLNPGFLRKILDDASSPRNNNTIGNKNNINNNNDSKNFKNTVSSSSSASSPPSPNDGDMGGTGLSVASPLFSPPSLQIRPFAKSKFPVFSVLDYIFQRIIFFISHKDKNKNSAKSSILKAHADHKDNKITVLTRRKTKAEQQEVRSSVSICSNSDATRGEFTPSADIFDSLSSSVLITEFIRNEDMGFLKVQCEMIAKRVLEKGNKKVHWSSVGMRKEKKRKR